MSEKDTSDKIPFTNLIDAKKLETAIMSTFSEEELNTATQNKLFSVSDDLLKLIADSNSALSVPAKKTRFCKLLAEVQLHENLDAQGKRLFFDVDFDK